MEGTARALIEVRLEPTDDELARAQAAWVNYDADYVDQVGEDPPGYEAWMLRWILADRIERVQGFLGYVVQGLKVDHEHDYQFQSYCGAYVCAVDGCEDHRGLARCYCGWAADGGNGRAQLAEMGETLEEEA